MPIDLSADLPVGAVVAWAGELPDKAPSGWLPCDGAEFSREALPELFAAIGTANGAPTPETFAVPDLRGVFLRGADDGSRRDPDAATRTVPFGSPAGPAEVGSSQDWTTALPHKPWAATVVGLPGSSQHRAYHGSNVRVIKPPETSTTFDLGGGDRETRPANVNVNHLIKATSYDDDDRSVVLPAAAVIGYAGDDAVGIDHAYTPCDGRVVTNEGIYAGVYEATGTIFGGNDRDFCLPDLRGAFLRGVSGASGRDPDADDRVVPRPDLAIGEQGAAGNHCGSRQDDATGNPPATPLQATFSLPTESYRSDKVAGRKSTEWNDASSTVVVSSGGGDEETRPIHARLTWYLRTAGRTDPTIPLGMVVACAGPVPASVEGRWLPCDGRLVPIDRYRDLYQVLGLRYGGGSTEFGLPDYRGVFLRGTSSEAGPGPIETWATRLPRLPFTAELAQLPVDYWQTAYTVFEPPHTVTWQSDTTVTPFSGGGAESRPSNVAVQFVIKVRHTAA